LLHMEVYPLLQLRKRDQWIDTLYEIMQEVNAYFEGEMSKYSYPNGPVTGSGVTIDGVIQVSINKSNTVDKPFMDKIYQIFDSKASRMGIKEVPVVFVYEDNPMPAIDTESPELGSKISDGNKSSKTNSIPGFGLLGSLICLYGGRKLRNK
jgi:hypothetical protein